jgi:hypothetical protein
VKKLSEKPELLNLGALNLDYDLYPRNQVDDQHVGRLAEALRSKRDDIDKSHVGRLAEALKVGDALPPIVAQEGTLMVVDGFHRIKAHERVFGKESKIEVELWSYKDNVEFFLHAMRLNATHGKNLSTYDKAHCMVIAERLQIKSELVSRVLSITPTTAKAIMENRADTRAAAPIPLRHGLQHLRTRVLSKEQATVVRKLDGKPVMYHADQLIKTMENGLMPEITVKLSEKLGRLRELLVQKGY